ncbi:hypothetical protein CALCODRAFT_31095 [Calocera cornea HHB12733]|uniref:Uncharacterized protein n=1 Tax=Calocera cornea HHB12733 TaxID=1353952 RepID=A0A165E329_9BASI|nr:hypothetical protein CALCODRAFT_31095 [Calocera cornea HHB12733]
MFSTASNMPPEIMRQHSIKVTAHPEVGRRIYEEAATYQEAKPFMSGTDEYGRAFKEVWHPDGPGHTFTFFFNTTEELQRAGLLPSTAVLVSENQKLKQEKSAWENERQAQANKLKEQTQAWEAAVQAHDQRQGEMSEKEKEILMLKEQVMKERLEREAERKESNDKLEEERFKWEKEIQAASKDDSGKSPAGSPSNAPANMGTMGVTQKRSQLQALGDASADSDESPVAKKKTRQEQIKKATSALLDGI